jgi:hypothetical protein
LALEVNRGALLALRLGRLKDAGCLRPEQVGMGKLGNVDQGRKDLLGGMPGSCAHESDR